MKLYFCSWDIPNNVFLAGDSILSSSSLGLTTSMCQQQQIQSMYEINDIAYFGSNQI